MKIKIKIDREGLSSHTIKSEIYAQDIGGMIYIIMGTSPIASILQVTDAHKKRVNDKETGWKITGNVGNWSPAIKESYFDSYEQAIENFDKKRNKRHILDDMRFIIKRGFEK